jgi:hypothetical protein
MEHKIYLGYHEKTYSMNHSMQKKERSYKLNASTAIFPRERENHQEAKSVQNTKPSDKKKHPRHIIIKALSTQDKEKILKAAKEKRQVICR